MKTVANRLSGAAATAAVHVGIAAVLLAGWQVTRPKPAPKPIIVTAIPQPVERQQPAAPTTREQPIFADIAPPTWDEARPVPVETPPVGDGLPPGAGAGTGDPGPITLPPAASGPTRTARLLAAGSMQPPYPSASRALGEEGTVELMVSIDAQGVVTGVNLLRSSGHARLDAAAIAFALKRWRFEAALEKGTPVASSRRFTIRFNLADG